MSLIWDKKSHTIKSIYKVSFKLVYEQRHGFWIPIIGFNEIKNSSVMRFWIQFYNPCMIKTLIKGVM